MPNTKPYYETYKNVLLKKLKSVQNLVNPEETISLFAKPTPEATFLKSLDEGITKFPLRYYQKEALYTFHHLYKHAIDICRSDKKFQDKRLKQKENDHIKQLLEIVDKDSNKNAPFFGFEMATGSGKTMLMGSTIYYLNKMHAIKNFLIITPSSTEIYKKTIRNFQIGTNISVWDDEVPFKPNIVSGDNFKDAKDLFSNNTDCNIFIFNIDKFGTNATQTKKQWEGSVWKDNEGNTISLLDYLSKNELIIITDEAHHAQSKKAKAVIHAFKPIGVLEYTATAIETGRSQNKKNQTIIYKYDIKRFLDDKYGKLVRVLALPGEETKERGKKTEITDIEKYKLQTYFLVHLIKKRSLLSSVETRDIKAIGFIKVKNEISYAEKIEKYVKEELAVDSESLNVIIEKSKTEDTETTNLIIEMFKNEFHSNIELLQSELKKVVNNSILLHSKSDKIIKKQFDDIQRNEVEIVIFIDMLNEGIDMPNIYSMVVINDKPTEFKTSVKQIVGRGVRLNKEQREYDDFSENDLITHTEKLHIVCDKGASFEDVILEIQKEFGLNDKTFAIERGEETVVFNPIKKEKIKSIRIPKIKIDFKRKKGVKILDVMQNYDLIISNYIKDNCFSREINGKIEKFLKYQPNSFFTEIDLFADESIFHKIGEDQNWNYEKLIVSDKDIKEIYGRVVVKKKPIPDLPQIYKIFIQYKELLNNQNINFYCPEDIDIQLAHNRLKDSFVYFYLNHIENEYFELDLDTLDSESDTWLLSSEFIDKNIKVRKNDIKNKTRMDEDRNKITELIKSGYYFWGYEQSLYSYDKFDSYPEKQLADYLNNIVNNTDNDSQFWLRNDRNIYFQYGSHKYYPDFIFLYNKIIYVIEIKGEKYSSVKKNQLLLELNKTTGLGDIDGYKGIVVYQTQMNNLKDFTKTFEDFIADAEEYFEQFQKKSEVFYEFNVPEKEKFKSFIPAYEARQAYSKYVLNKKPKHPKWIKVKKIDSYPRTVFAVLVKNTDVGDVYYNNWLIMDSKTKKIEDIKSGMTIFCFHPDIESKSYKKHLMIRNLHVVEKEEKLGMFTDIKRSIVLSDYTEDDKIVLDDKLNEFRIIATKY